MGSPCSLLSEPVVVEFDTAGKISSFRDNFDVKAIEEQMSPDPSIGK